MRRRRTGTPVKTEATISAMTSGGKAGETDVDARPIYNIRANFTKGGRVTNRARLKGRLSAETGTKRGAETGFWRCKRAVYDGL